MKNSVVVLLMILYGAFPLAAQDYEWDDYGYDGFDYDWDAEIEEPPDFVDPYAPAPPAPAPAQSAPVPPAPAPTVEPETAEAPEAEEPAGIGQDMVEGVHYRIFSDTGEEDATALLRELELRMDCYNRLFRFEPERIAGPLQVRSVSDTEAYETYARSRLGQAPPGAVYIHYDSPEKRELVINRGSDAETAMVAHQAFIQYLRAFVPHPPSWMLDGFAIIFSSLRVDPALETAALDENLVWLDTVKKMGAAAPPPRLILLADTGEHGPGGIDNFKPLSWALASFFLQHDAENYFRALTEMFMVLSPDADAAENSLAAARRLTLWTDYETLAGDCHNYLESKKSFAELIAEGQRAYSEGDLEGAERSFDRARSMRPDHAVPCYYQGLLAYGARDFARAEELYNAALCNGADAALVRYALGLNAVSAGRAADGIRWLEEAAAAGPDRFGEKAAGIIGRLR